MFGDLALRLAKEARAAQLTDTIQPYKWVDCWDQYI